MISFPIAKINLGLSIVSKRQDGFHDLETIFYPLPIKDILEIIPADSTQLITSGFPVSGKPDANLVLQAYKRVLQHFPGIGSLEIHLHKAIPMGAGLGGGSSDAASMLVMLNDFFRLHISREKLMEFALELGSDCPFFIQGLPVFAMGRGEQFEPVKLDLSGYSFLLIHPEIKIETSWAFSKIKPGRPKFKLKESIIKPIQYWEKEVVNDFEIPLFETYPFLSNIKHTLYQAGALYASMTGSGSTIFGIFEKGMVPEISLDNVLQTVLR